MKRSSRGSRSPGIFIAVNSFYLRENAGIILVKRYIKIKDVVELKRNEKRNNNWPGVSALVSKALYFNLPAHENMVLQRGLIKFIDLKDNASTVFRLY